MSAYVPQPYNARLDTLVDLSTPETTHLLAINSSGSLVDGTATLNAAIDVLSGSMVTTEFDDNSAIYIYYGGTKSSNWKVNRVHRTTFVKQSATIANNSGVANLSAAWSARTSLTYA